MEKKKEKVFYYFIILVQNYIKENMLEFGKDLSRYSQEHFQTSLSLRQSKDEMIEMLKLLHFKG